MRPLLGDFPDVKLLLLPLLMTKLLVPKLYSDCMLRPGLSIFDDIFRDLLPPPPVEGVFLVSGEFPDTFSISNSMAYKN